MKKIIFILLLFVSFGIQAQVQFNKGIISPIFTCANKTMHDGANDTIASLIVSNVVDSAFVGNIDFVYANSDGTDVQTRCGKYLINCPIKAGAITSATFTSAVASEVLTSGSLTETLSLSYVKASGTIYIIVKYDSSITPTANKLSYTITSYLGVASSGITTYNFTY